MKSVVCTILNKRANEAYWWYKEDHSVLLIGASLFGFPVIIAILDVISR